MQKKRQSLLTIQSHRFINNVPGGIRTPDRSLRRRMLYPAELQVQYRNRNYYTSFFLKSQSSNEKLSFKNEKPHTQWLDEELLLHNR